MIIFWYIEQSWDAIFHIVNKMFLLVCFLNFILALVINNPLKNKIKRKEATLILSPIIFSILMMLWGILMADVDQADGIVRKWPMYVVNGILVLQLLWSGYIAYKLKNLRWITLSTGLLFALYTLGVRFVTYMAVTGNWL